MFGVADRRFTTSSHAWEGAYGKELPIDRRVVSGRFTSDTSHHLGCCAGRFISKAEQGQA